MIQKETHIIFGHFAENILLESKAIDLDKNQLLILNDRLNIGPLCDLSPIDRIENRKKWFKESFGNSYETSSYLEVIDKDITTIKSIINNYKNISKLFLWNGFSAYEIIGTARLLFNLPESIKDIYIIDFPHIPVKQMDESILYPEILGVTAPEQVSELHKNFEEISKNDLLKWKNLWKKLITEQATLRILCEDGEIYKKEEDFYDSFLISHCNKEYQSAARVIGYTLCDANFNVGDSFLNLRLKQLVLCGKLEAKGVLREIREYKVKKINSEN